MEVIVIKKTFILFVFLSFYMNIGFGADTHIPDQCYNKKYSFKDPLVQQFIDDYRSFITAYIKALNKKDVEEMQNLALLSQELGERGPMVAERLTDADEAQKFSDEITEMAKCFTDHISESLKQ